MEILLGRKDTGMQRRLVSRKMRNEIMLAPITDENPYKCDYRRVARYANYSVIVRGIITFSIDLNFVTLQLFGGIV